MGGALVALIVVFSAAGARVLRLPSALPSLRILRHVDVPGIGRLEVEPGQEAAEAIELFAGAATHAGLRVLNVSEMTLLRETLCAAGARCSRSLTGRVAVGECACEPFEDPVDAVARCARRDIVRGRSATRFDVEEKVRRLCAMRICGLRLPPPLTFHVTPLGFVTVEPWEEPAEVVEKFVRSLVATGTPPVARDAAVAMVEWFCARRDCHRHLASDLTVEVEVGHDETIIADCAYWEPPEFAVLRFRKETQGLVVDKRSVDVAAARVLSLFCAVKPCGWRLEHALTLNVWSFENASVGELTCAALHDPADCVESFVRKSLGFGFVLPSEDLKRAMGMMMDWLCRRRRCSRPLAPEVRVIGRNLAANSWEEPWRVAAEYAKTHAGIVTENDVRTLYMDMCRHRYYCANLPPNVGVIVDGVGNVTCRSWEQPADVVESFAYQAVRVGHTLRARDLQDVLDLMCSQRDCARRKLSVVAAMLVMHPGKTAGRALGTALRRVTNIFVLGHDVRCGDDSRQCFIVLRDPRDRLVSALAFKKQGGEWGGERLLGNVCRRWLVDKHIDNVLADVDGLNAYCEFSNATADASTHCIFRPLRWWVADNEAAISFMCYDRLQADFDTMLRPHCRPECTLVQQNPSNHSLILGGAWDETALDRFVRHFYAEDLALYERHCGGR